MNRTVASQTTNSLWAQTPAETEPRYFRTWQSVSLHLQKTLLSWVSAAYFSHPSRAADREAGYSTVVYAACRRCYGRRPADFTFDVADPDTLPSAWRNVGRSMQTELERLTEQIKPIAPPPLVRRYAPVWHQDILIGVQKKPRRLIALLAAESTVINALIDWGTMRNGSAEKRFAKACGVTARAFDLFDAAQLRARVLSEAQNALGGLSQSDHGVGDLVNRGILENLDPIASRSPDPWIR